ncbi:HU family DNA-binding protein [Candidatus Bipolaricaulota bacterium]
MNTTELVDQLARMTGLTKSEARATVEGLAEVISVALGKDEPVIIPGFGKFETRKRRALTRLNLQTGQRIKTPARTVPAFKAGKNLKDLVALRGNAESHQKAGKPSEGTDLPQPRQLVLPVTRESTTTGMVESEFRPIVERLLVPMLAARLADLSVPSSEAEALVAQDGDYRLLVKPTRGSDYRLVIERNEDFGSNEKELTKQFVKSLSGIAGTEDSVFREDIVNAIPRRVIASHLDGGETLHSILRQLENWSARTYEGQRIAAAVGLSPNPAGSNLHLRDYWEEEFAPVLTNGIDTLLVCGSDSQIAGFEQLESSGELLKAPFQFRHLASWARNGSISAALNRQAEILLFRDGELKFARRSGIWIHYSHDTSIKRMVPPQDVELREAIYASCLDVSYARTGGCLCVVSADQSSKLREFVSQTDMITSGNTTKNQVLASAIGGVFQELDRRLRRELLSLDGAMVLDHRGTVLAVGAIVKVPAGSTGGGRLAAAKKLSEYGLGIKISQDGGVTGFRGGRAAFTA